MSGDATQRNLPESDEAVEQGHRGGLGAEGTLGLRPSAEFPVEILQRVGRPQALPQRPGESVEAQKVQTGFLETRRNTRAERRPLRDESVVGSEAGGVILRTDDRAEVSL